MNGSYMLRDTRGWFVICAFWGLVLAGGAFMVGVMGNW